MNPRYVRTELERAAQALRAAQLLRREELFADAVSRAYYAVMHASRAALLAHDAIAESHSAVRRLFGDVLVRPGLIERKWASILSTEQNRRIAADYQPTATWTSEDVQSLVQDAEAFVRRMRDHLSSIRFPIEDPRHLRTTISGDDIGTRRL